MIEKLKADTSIWLSFVEKNVEFSGQKFLKFLFEVTKTIGFGTSEAYEHEPRPCPKPV